MMAEVQDLVKQLQKQLELKNQALYDCERQRKTTEALLLEYQEEIKVLQNDGVQENKKLKEKIQHLEESNLSLKVSYNDRLNYLEKELTNKDEEICELKREIDDIIKISGQQQPSDDDKLLEEIACLKEHSLELAEEVEDLTKICEDKEMEITTLQETNMQLKEELESCKEILDCKKQELDEANTLIQNLKDDYICVKSELDLVRSKPLDDKSKGNSLFAEVDDRRVQLQQNMNMMKTKYLEMKRERASHLKQIAVLRNENANLLAQWESGVNEQKDDEDMILQSYKNQIRTLNELIESYKKESKEEINYDDRSVKFFDKMITSKNQEIEGLKTRLSANSLNETVLAHDLANARREIRKYKLEILKLQNDMGQLKVEIGELKLYGPAEKQLLEEEKIELASTGMFKTEKSNNIDLSETNKENNTVDKRVQFSENTIEPKVTDRSKYKKGAKILESKPIYVSGISQKIN